MVILNQKSCQCDLAGIVNHPCNSSGFVDHRTTMMIDKHAWSVHQLDMPFVDPGERICARGTLKGALAGAVLGVVAILPAQSE